MLRSVLLMYKPFFVVNSVFWFIDRGIFFHHILIQNLANTYNRVNRELYELILWKNCQQFNTVQNISPLECRLHFFLSQMKIVSELHYHIWITIQSGLWCKNTNIAFRRFELLSHVSEWIPEWYWNYSYRIKEWIFS